MTNIRSWFLFVTFVLKSRLVDTSIGAGVDAAVVLVDSSHIWTASAHCWSLLVVSGGTATRSLAGFSLDDGLNHLLVGLDSSRLTDRFGPGSCQNLISTSWSPGSPDHDGGSSAGGFEPCWTCRAVGADQTSAGHLSGLVGGSQRRSSSWDQHRRAETGTTTVLWLTDESFLTLDFRETAVWFQTCLCLFWDAHFYSSTKASHHQSPPRGQIIAADWNESHYLN